MRILLTGKDGQVGFALHKKYVCFLTDEAIRLGLKTTMTSQDIQ